MGRDGGSLVTWGVEGPVMRKCPTRKRCMSRATTVEAEQQCEASRWDCQQTFCECPGLGCPSARPGQVQQASACSDACDAKLDSCLAGGGVRWDVCFDRHTSCVNGCGDIELGGHHDAVSR